MIKFIKKKIFIAMAILVMLVAFMCIRGAQNVNAAVSYKEVDSLDVGSIKSGTKTSGDFTFSQSTGAYTSKPEFDFVVTGKGDTVTMTYNNTKQYDIRKVRLGVSVSLADNADFKITKGTTSTTKAITNDNNTEFDVELPSSTAKIDFTFIATEDCPYASINQVQFWVHEITLYEINPQESATITAGTGVHDVFLSSKTGVTTGDASGTFYDEGTTVYGYARIYGSYKPQSDWTFICKDTSLDKPYYLYLIGTKTINGAAVNFGTITAILRDPKAITLNNNGGEGSGSVTITPNQSTTVDLSEISKDCADFVGWNTKADGSGITYTSTLSKDDIDVLFGDGIETLYAQWMLASNIQNVIDLIDAIGTVTLDSEEAIVAARSAYGALTEGEKTAVSNYATLTAAEARLDEIKTNIATGDNVKSLIDAIGEVTYPESGDKINAARNAYDALTNDEQRARVTNYATLTDAETLYNTLKVNGANAVSNMINNLGEATLDSEDEIVAARSAYDALTKEQKELIKAEVYGKLTSAEATLKSIHDQIAADAVKELIANIGDVEYSETIKNKLYTANTRYEALTADQKVLVTNYNELETKTNIYVRVEAVYVLIDSINNVTYNNSCKKSINEARSAYDSLSDDEKELVTNYNELETKTNIYVRVEAVCVLIDSINNVKYNNSCKESINEARSAYDSLSDDEKELVINYSKLTNAETKYNDLKNDHEVFVGWMIALGIILGIILVLGIVYVLFFFVFNKWIVIDEKPVRVFRIGKKNDNVRLLKMTFMVIYRDEEAIFNKKEDINN